MSHLLISGLLSLFMPVLFSSPVYALFSLLLPALLSFSISALLSYLVLGLAPTHITFSTLKIFKQALSDKPWYYYLSSFIELFYPLPVPNYKIGIKTKIENTKHC